MKQPMAPAMALALQANFGSVERWRAEFAALCGESRWALLAFQPREGTLINRQAANHADALATGIPILVLDMHAAGRSVEALIDDIDWSAVYERYQHAVHAASEALAASQDELANAIVLDVRRAGVFEQAADVIPGSRWQDPMQVEQWASSLPRDRDVVVYCVYGHEVGRSTAMRLCAAGLKARFLTGGIDGWKASGRPLEPKKASS
jgi:Fe-Mn family superoxide dismutase